MKSQDRLVVGLLNDFGRYCGIDTSRDIKTVLARSEREGMGFYTLTLPTFGKALERCLDEGRFVSDLFLGFKLGSGGLPRFLSGFLRRIFHTDGTVRDTTPEMVYAIKAVRQITLAFSKYEDECSPDRVKAAFDQYVSTDRQVLTEIPAAALSGFNQEFRRLFGDMLDSVENGLNTHEHIPFRHGPGAVQGGQKSNEKYSVNTWTERLEKVLSAESSLAANLHDFLDQTFQYLTEDQEPPVRVIAVPKTMKGPRLIAIEPVWTQYVQQGLLSVLTDAMLASPVRHLCDWTDQSYNRRMASEWQKFATLDLSEASDRVPLALVSSMLEPWPLLRSMVLASRSTRAELPDGSIIRLNKFASMGSALCFPVECMVFTTLSVWAVKEQAQLRHNTGPSAFRGLVRIFGDDMVVPIDAVPYLLVLLETFGFKVNVTKSFWNGKFRESCGADWYDGHDVSYIKVRSNIDQVRRNDLAVQRLVALHNALYEQGLWQVAMVVEDRLKKLGLGYYAPLGSTSCAMWTWDLTKVRLRFHPHLHKPQVKSIVTKLTLPHDPLDGYGALRKFFISKTTAETPYVLTDKEHLSRSGRPLCANNHIGWSDL